MSHKGGNWYRLAEADTTAPSPHITQCTATLRSQLKPKSTDSPNSPDAHSRERDPVHRHFRSTLPVL